MHPLILSNVGRSDFSRTPRISHYRGMRKFACSVSLPYRRSQTARTVGATLGTGWLFTEGSWSQGRQLPSIMALPAPPQRPSPPAGSRSRSSITVSGQMMKPRHPPRLRSRRSSPVYWGEREPPSGGGGASRLRDARQARTRFGAWGTPLHHAARGPPLPQAGEDTRLRTPTPSITPAIWSIVPKNGTPAPPYPCGVATSFSGRARPSCRSRKMMNSAEPTTISPPTSTCHVGTSPNAK